MGPNNWRNGALIDWRSKNSEASSEIFREVQRVHSTGGSSGSKPKSRSRQATNDDAFWMSCSSSSTAPALHFTPSFWLPIDYTRRLCESCSREHAHRDASSHEQDVACIASMDVKKKKAHDAEWTAMECTTHDDTFIKCLLCFLMSWWNLVVWPWNCIDGTGRTVDGTSHGSELK